MRIDVRVPYFARVRRAGERAFRQGKVTVGLPVEVAEETARSCPLALVTFHRGRAAEHRSIKGVLASRMPRPEGYADDEAWLRACASDPFLSGGIHFGGILEGTANCPAEDEPGLEVRPYPPEWDRVGREAAIADAVRTCERLAVVDGRLWRRHPDPVLRVRCLSERPQVTLEEAHEEGTSCPDSVATFALSQRSCLQRFFNVGCFGKRAAIPMFETVDAGLFGDRDYQAEGLAYAAGVVLRQGGRPGVEADGLLEAVRMASGPAAGDPAALARALESYRPLCATKEATMATWHAVAAYRATEPLRAVALAEDEEDAARLSFGA